MMRKVWSSFRVWTRSPWGRRVGRLLLGTLLLGIVVATVALVQAWEALGTAPAGERLNRMAGSSAMTV